MGMGSSGSEVKGRTSPAETVDLTHREVAAASECDGSVLAVVDQVVVEESGGSFVASGGNVGIWLSWTPQPENLKPNAFRYELVGEPDFEIASP
jgi:hypothetical protein|tara:strand:- start:163 stop:444 length:282 start_codon:yes stop_codon:yes gene_type:complete